VHSGRTRARGAIASVADRTIVLANGMVADARALSRDLRALLARWSADPTTLAAQLARSDWILDGWARICAIWDSQPEAVATILEMAALVPVVPREVDEWLSQRGTSR
jgi:hypothetical protein